MHFACNCMKLSRGVARFKPNDVVRNGMFVTFFCGKASPDELAREHKKFEEFEEQFKHINVVAHSIF